MVQWFRFVFPLVVFLSCVASFEGFLYLFLTPTELFDKVGRIIYYSYFLESDDVANFPLFAWDINLFENHKIAFYAHIFFGPIALLIGPWQLLPSFRRKYIKLHTYLGYVYYVSQLIALPAGMILGMYEYAGLPALYGFLGMGGSTLLCSAMAFYAIKKANYDEHREWMLRSYFIMWSSVVLFRLAIIFWIPLEVRRIGGNLPQQFQAPYIVSIYLSWSLALLAADVYISLTKLKIKEAAKAKRK